MVAARAACASYAWKRPKRLRILIDKANAIANGETRQSPSEAAVAGHGGGQAAIDVLFDRQTSAFGRGAVG
jgi:hypothetical protein